MKSVRGVLFLTTQPSWQTLAGSVIPSPVDVHIYNMPYFDFVQWPPPVFLSERLVLHDCDLEFLNCYIRHDMFPLLQEIVIGSATTPEFVRRQLDRCRWTHVREKHFQEWMKSEHILPMTEEFYQNNVIFKF
jgi:hypothetical protein